MANTKTNTKPAGSAQIYEAVTAQIVAQLEQGAAPWVKPWRNLAPKTKGGVFPHNANTGRKYSGVNVLLLWMAQMGQGFNSSGWLTFNQAKAAGGQVRKGEKGTAIYFPIKVEREQEKMDKATGQITAEKFELMLWRAMHVFNVEQIDGLEGTEAAPVAGFAEDELMGELVDVVERVGLAGGLHHGGNSAFYNVIADSVTMPQMGQFNSVDTYAATLLHELTHATGNAKRLDRESLNTPTSDRKAYAFEELVAELGAAFTCAQLGVDGELRHADYLAHWLELLKEDKRAIFRAASQARKAAAFLLGETEQPEQTEQSNERHARAA